MRKVVYNNSIVLCLKLGSEIKDYLNWSEADHKVMFGFLFVMLSGKFCDKNLD